MYPIIDGVPALISNNNRHYNDLYKIIERSNNAGNRVRSNLLPEPRVWSRESKMTIRKLLNEVEPDNPRSTVINIGSAPEKVFARAFEKYNDIIRIGMPAKGLVDFWGDAMELPIAEGTVDLVFSSSVIEHLSDPAGAVRELHRILKKGGRIYAEIPFLRASHGKADYQRYTLQGIEELFSSQHFRTEQKGICSGPATTP